MGRDDQANKRTDSMRVRLSPEMMQRFQAIAADFGMAPSTLAAFAIVSFVRMHEPSSKSQFVHEITDIAKNEKDF